jgi:hypothetical protein
MLNRIFFISENAFQNCGDLPAEDNVHFSVLVNPSLEQSLNSAYNFMARADYPNMSLTLNIREPMVAERMRSIISFLFMVSYPRIRSRPVINLTGDSPELLERTVFVLFTYFASQGIDDPIINKIYSASETLSKKNQLFDSPEKLVGYYQALLQSDLYYNNDIFFCMPSIDILRSTLESLKQIELDFKESFPKLYSLAGQNMRLEDETSFLKKKNLYTETELNHQKQYIDILRSDHSTRELQNYYNKEYEILPLWYKRFGHLLKVITGKRTFRSLFRDDVKIYKD